MIGPLETWRARRPGGAVVRRVVGAAALCAVAGCAPALRPPPSLADLAGTDRDSVDPEAAAVHALQAEESFGRRPDLDAVRVAERLWLLAAVEDPSLIGSLLGAVRAKVWLANHLADGEARERAAVTAVQTAQWCERRAADDPRCPYWLALAIGVQSRERTSTGHSGVTTMVRLLRSVIEVDPNLDRAGPHRVLARVLVEAPGWPTGPGDPEEGLQQARRAVELFPDYPPNLMALAGAHLELDDRAASREAYERALAAARPLAATGDPDASEWVRDAEAALAAIAAR